MLLRGLDEAGDEARRLELTDELSRRLKVVLLGVQEPIPLPEGPLALRVDFPAPTARLARQIWEDELAGRACGDASPRLLADKYVLPPGQVREILDRAEMDAALHGEARLSARRIVAFGDNGNDEGLFAGADLRVAVRNATPGILALADRVIGENTQDAVVRCIAEMEGLDPERL